MSRLHSFHEIMGAPLHAILQSQMQAAKVSLDYIEEVGFAGESTDDGSYFGEVRTITFYYQVPGTAQYKTLEIPLLALVPIPYLEIAEASLDMDISLRQRHSGGNSASFLAQLVHKDRPNRKQVGLRMQVRQSPLPRGVQALLKQIQGQIHEKESGYITLAPTTSTLDFEGESSAVLRMEMQAFDAEGNPQPDVYMEGSYLYLQGNEGVYQPDDFDYSNQKYQHTQEDGKLRFTFTVRHSELGETLPESLRVRVQLPAEADFQSAECLVPLVY